MAVIIMISIIIFILLGVWCWHNLGKIEKNKKIIYIIAGILIIYLITNIVFAISKQNINYQNKDIESAIGNSLVLIFTGVNCLITMPYLAIQIDKLNEEEIEKEKFRKKVVILTIIFIICLFFECGYLENTQNGILKIYNAQK